MIRVEFLRLVLGLSNLGGLVNGELCDDLLNLVVGGLVLIWVFIVVRGVAYTFFAPGVDGVLMCGCAVCSTFNKGLGIGDLGLGWKSPSTAGGGPADHSHHNHAGRQYTTTSNRQNHSPASALLSSLFALRLLSELDSDLTLVVQYHRLVLQQARVVMYNGLRVIVGRPGHGNRVLPVTLRT